MAFGQWWLTYGPGSPGSIARAMANAFVRIRNANPGRAKSELLAATLASRYQMLDDLKQTEASEMLREAEGSLAQLTVQVWLRDNPHARGAVLDAPGLYMQGVRVIAKETRKIAPDVA